jgi:hypothetical protein
MEIGSEHNQSSARIPQLMCIEGDWAAIFSWSPRRMAYTPSAISSPLYLKLHLAFTDHPITVWAG